MKWKWLGALAIWSLIFSVGLFHPLLGQTNVPPKPTPLNQEVVQATLRHLNQQDGKNKLQITRTVVVGDYALANWMRGQAGGQALLQSVNAQWQVLDWGGGAMNQATLTRLGVPSTQINQLLQRRSL